MNSKNDSNKKLTKVIEEFKKEVEIKNPNDIIAFAAKYFTKLSAQENESDASDPDKSREYDSSSEDEDSLKEIMSNDQSKMKLTQTSNVPRQSITCESFDPSSIDDETFEKNRKIYPKTEKQMDKIADILETIFFFNCLDESQFAKVIQSMFFIEVFEGDEIIKENDTGNNFYIIDYGTFTAFNKSKTIYEKYEGKGFFGELALLYNCPRSATVVANTDGRLWVIDRVTFRQLILKSAYQKRQRYLKFISSVPLLEGLTKYEQCNLADALKTKNVNNDKILSQGDTGDKMYFIEEGEVLVTVRTGDEEREETRLKAGDYFGEVALLAKIPRIANVYAIGATKLAELDAKSYTRLLGPCVDNMRKNFTKYRSRLEKLLSRTQLEELFPELIN